MHASPDAGPVDLYVYTGATRPATPTIPAAAYPQINDYPAQLIGTLDP